MTSVAEEIEISPAQKGLARVMSETYNEGCTDWSNSSIYTTELDLIECVMRY